MPINEGIAQAEVLRHAHQGLVYGAVAMRMELAEHVADNARALQRLGRRTKPKLVAHGVKNSSLDRLETITDIRQGPGGDHAHRVIQIPPACGCVKRHILDGIMRLGLRTG